MASSFKSKSKLKPYTFYTKATWRRKLVAWSMLLVYLTQPILASAEVIADPKAPIANTPRVETAANGVPIVQIAAPSATGVSRNLYQQFNVDPSGLILNNSKIITQTQLAGYITGNPNLANGSARIILNEVTSNNPSYLRGYTEVAGQKAEVIIANPNGIYGNGFGFINTSRAVLTTGTPVFGGSGSLEAFRVNKGSITIEGNGLAATGTDQVDLISQAVAVNAGIWAKELNIVTGSNNVQHDNLTTEKIAAEGALPTVALDVSALGGMYANKIKLIGTEKGVGVNSQGTIAASSGGLTLTQEGKIQLGGTASSSENIVITGQDDIVHTGQLYGQTVTVRAAGALANSGLLAAAGDTVIAAQTLQSTGTLGAGIHTDGTTQTAGNLTVTTSGAASATGRTVAAGDLVMGAAALELAGGTTYAGQNASFTAAQGNLDNTGGTVEARHSLTLNAQGAVSNRAGGSLTAEQITVTAANLDNQSGSISQSGISATTLTAAQTLDNTNGKILTNGEAVLTAKMLQNDQGILAAEQHIVVQADTLSNKQGTLASDGAIQLTANDTVNNTDGIIEAGHGLVLTAKSLKNEGGSITSLGQEDLAVTVSGDLTNQSGLIGGNGDVQVTAGNLANQVGKVTAKENLKIQSQAGIDNSTGTLSAGQDISLTQAVGTLTNTAGTIQAGEDLTITAEGVTSAAGRILAKRDVTVTANQVSTSGQLLAGRDLQLTVANGLVNQGEIQADVSVTLQADGIIANDGNITALQGATISGGDIDNGEDGVIKSGSALNIDAAGKLSNAGTVYAKDDLHLQAAETISNTGVLAGGRNTTVAADQVTSIGIFAAGLQSNGSLGSTGDLMIRAQNAVTSKGQTLAAGHLVIQGSAVDSSGGTTYAGNNATITATSGDVSNIDGSLEAGQDLTITAQGNVTNDGGRMQANAIAIGAANISNREGDLVQLGQGTTTLLARESLDNTEGYLATNGQDLTLRAKNLTNSQGEIKHAGTGAVTITADGTVENIAGRMITNGQVQLAAENMQNTGGRVAAANQLSLTTDNLDNTTGVLVSQDNLQLTAAAIDNRAGLIEGGKSVAITAQTLANENGSITSLDDSELNLIVQGTVTNQEGLIGGNGNVQVAAKELNNAGGEVRAKADLTVHTTADIENTQGLLSAGKDLSINQTAGTFSNPQGAAQAGNDLTMTADNIANGVGEILANRDIYIQAQTVQNSGIIGAGRDMSFHLQGAFANESESELQASRKLTLTTDGAITNQGKITALEDVAISATDITITGDGTVKSGKVIALESDTLTNAGTVYAKTDLAVEATASVRNTGVLAAGSNTALMAEELESTGTLAAGLNSDGTIGTTGDLTIATTDTAAMHGQTLAGSNLTLTGTAIDLSSGITYAGNRAELTATSGDLDNTGGTLQAADLSIRAQGALINDKNAVAAGGIKADKLTIRTDTISNKGGTLVQYGQTDLTLSAANGIDNAAGQIATSSINLTIDTDNFTNTQGQVQHAGNGRLTIQTAGDIANNSGKIISNGAMNLISQEMDNSQGTITAQRKLDITAKALDNTKGVIVGKEAVHLTAQGAVMNREGTIEAGKGLRLTAQRLDDQNGSVTSLDDSGLDLSVEEAVTNEGGLIGGNGNVQIAAESLTNTAGRIVAKADLDLTTDGDITNTQGTLSAGHNLTIEQMTGSFTNAQGTAQAGNDLAIQAATISNTAGRILANQDLTLNGKMVTSSGLIYGGRDVRVTLEGDFTNEAGGEIQADHNLILTADGSVTNNGKLTALGEAVISGGSLVNTNGASLKSGRSFTLSTTGNMTNDGSLYAKEDLTASSAGTMSNSGAVAAGGNTALTAQSIHSIGTLVAGIQGDGSVGMSGDLTVTAADAASLSGRNLAGHTVTVTGTAIDTSNSTTYAGTRATLTATAGDVDNNGGTLTAKEVAITAQGAVKNNKNANGAASIQADKMSIQAKSVRNQGGTLIQYGQSDLTLTAAEGIDNSGGQIATNSTNLTIETNHLANTQGQIQHAGSGNLVLVTSGQLDNTQGRIISNGTVAIDSGAVTNTNGSVSAKEQLTMEADSLTNRQGVLVSQKAIQLTVQGAADNQQGVVEAGKGLQLTAQSLDNGSGKLTSLDGSGLVLTTDGEVHNQAGLIGSNGAITLTANGLSNTGGQVQAKTDLTVQAVHDVNNTAGTLSAGHDLTLTQQAGTLTNTQGTIQAGNDLSVNAATIANTQGRLLAARDATLTGQTVTNSGTFYGGRDVNVDLTGAFTNGAGGEVQADRNVALTVGGTLTNQGKMTALQAATLQGAAISNSAAGAIKSGGNMMLEADGNLTNSGTVVAQGNLEADSGGTLSNTGVLAAAGNVTVQAQQITSGGTLAAGIQSDGALGTSRDLTVTAAHTAALQGQTLAAHDLTVTGAAVDLTGGTAYAGHTAAITATTGSIDNSGATLEAKDTAKLTAATGSVINTKNTAQLAGTIRAGQLDITAKTIRNQGGTLIQYGTGDTTITATAFDNTGGQLATNGTNLTLSANTILNTNGQIQHAGTGVFSLQAAAELDNSGGRLITNGAGDMDTAVFTNKSGTVSVQKQLTVDTNSLDSDQGILVTKDTLTVTAQAAVKNRQGVIEAGKGLSLTAQAVDNEHGSITSLGEQTLQITATGAVGNQSGLIGGNGEVSVTAASLANQGGTVQAQGNLTLTTPQGVDNTHGTLSAGKDLTLDQAGSTLRNDQGKVEAGQSLNIKTKEIANTAGRLAANKNVTLAFTGLTGDGTVEAGQDLALTIAGSFTNEAGNTWKANNDVTIAATGAITNRGSLEAGDNLTVSGSSVTNEATGLLAANKELNVTTAGDFTNTGSIFGKEITVTADRIVNANETAVIAANEKVKLFAATSVANLDGATIYSQGDIAIAGSAEQDAAGQYVTRTGELLNQSASIEAERDISISADEVVNKKREFVTEERVISSINYTSIPIQERDYSFESYDGSKWIEWDGIQLPNEPLKDNLRFSTQYFYAVKDAIEELMLRDGVEVSDIITETEIIKDSQIGKIIANQNMVLHTRDILNNESQIMAGNSLNATGTIRNFSFGNIRTHTTRVARLQPAQGHYREDFYVVSYPIIKIEDVVEKEQLSGNTSTIFGGGQSVTIQGTNVNNVTLTPGSVINTFAPINTSGHPGSATSQTSSNSPAATGINTNVTGSSFAVNNGSGITSAGQAGSAAVLQTGNTTLGATGINTNVSSSGVEVNNDNGVTASGQSAGNAVVNQDSGTAHTATNVNTNVSSDGVTVNFGSVTSSGQASNAAVSQGNITTITAQINTTVSTGGIPAENIQTLLPSAQTGPVTPTQTNNGGTIAVPANGMYAVHTEPTAHYLVETNPRFTAYNNFISSDYMLDKLNIDPATTMKRLGDGFYEQKLVREQITDLTGRVFLSGYDSAEAQYKALLENGAAFAQTFNLQVGIALTAEQMSQLTTSIVWMVEKEIDGQKVLTPVVYLPQLREGDLKVSGAVIAADNVIINATGTVTNAGAIKANEQVQISAANINNLGGAIDGGSLTHIAAAEDLFNLSGTISGDNINLSAGRDIKSETVTFTTEIPFHASTTSGNVASIQAVQNLTITAGQDISLLGTTLNAGTDLNLAAGHSLDIGSVAGQDNWSWGGGAFTKEQTNNLQSSLSAGGNLNLFATDMNLQGVQVKADENINLSALGNVNITSVQDQTSSTNQYYFGFNNQATTTNKVSLFEAGNDLTLKVGQDLNLTGVQVSAGNALSLAVGGDILMSVVKDSAFSDIKTGSSRNYKRNMTYDETVIGTNLAATGDITLGAIDSITMAGSSAISEEGGITLNAGKDITVEAVTEKHEALTESKKTKSGFLSKKTTTKRDYALVNEVVGSTLSGETVDISTDHDLAVKASNIVATNDLNLTAGNDLTITSMAETGAEDHYSYTKKSGLFSGGGLGFTIGSKSEKLTVEEKTLAEIGSTIGSIAGDVTLTAGNQLNSAGANISAGLDIDITGKTVTIDNTINTYDSTTKYEVKQSGLSVSLGGTVVNKGLDAVNSIERAGQVADERLQALYAYKAYDDIKDLSKIKNSEDLKQSVNVSVSVGSSKSTSEQTVHMETVNTSNISAGQTVTITATGDDVNLTGTKIDAKDITIQAVGDINLDAAQNQQQTTSNSKNSSWGAGMQLGTGIFGSISKGSSKENGTTTTNSGSSVTARDTLTLLSGNDTNIIGSKVTGDTVVAEIGGNLTIASLQDIDNYSAKSTNSGLSAGIGQGIAGFYNKGKTNSNYQSVTDQAGIYAGEGGFDIEVGTNTDLKGAVIASDATPDKNKLSTDTLTYSDIQNNAEYSASSLGVNLDTRKGTEKKDAGLTPNIGGTASGDADSTTKSAVSPGTIEVRSNPNQDVSNLSRDTTGALNALDKIFDKKTVQEKQELANLFGEVAFNAIGDLALSQYKKAQDKRDNATTVEEKAYYQNQMNQWDEGGSNKILLHALAGGIMSDLGGNGFASGVVSAGVNEAIQKQLSKITDPGLHQLASALVGGVAAKIVGGDASVGASVTVSATKNNILSHKEAKQMADELSKCKTKEEEKAVLEKWDKISKERDAVIEQFSIEFDNAKTDEEREAIYEKIRKQNEIWGISGLGETFILDSGDTKIVFDSRYEGLSKEKKEILYKLDNAKTPGEKLKYSAQFFGQGLAEQFTTYRDSQYNLALNTGLTPELAAIAADYATWNLIGPALSIALRTGDVVGSGLGNLFSKVEITAGKNFKDHFISHKKILEDVLGTKYPKYKTDGSKFIEDIGKIINDGTVQLVGQGTLKKGTDICNIYRGNGMTVVTKPNGEFVTILEQGKGMDLGIQFLK